MEKPNSNFILPDEAWRNERLRTWIALLKREMLGDGEVFNTRYASCNDGVVPYDQRERLDYISIGEGELWGRTRNSAWFQLEGQVPVHWSGEKVIAELNFHGECAIYGDNGEPLQRLTEFSIYDPWYCVDTYPLFQKSEGGEKVKLWIQAFASSINGIPRDEDPAQDDPNRGGFREATIQRLRLRTVREEVRALYFEAETLHLLALALPEYSVRRSRIICAMMKAVVAYRDDFSNAAAARALLKEELAKPSTSSNLTARAIGHAHIDTGWLWRIEEGIRKCERTFASQLQLLDTYPYYVFGASSAQHYAYVQESCPAIYARIKEKIAEYRWEIQGAMWVESDTVLPSGESLVRQFVFGKRYFQKEFGIDVRHTWLPDVFGLTASLPQIMRLAGVDCLVTKKPHWNRRNVFPHTTFRWQGHDGSQVVVHILPQDRDYNGKMQSDDLLKAEQGFVEKDRLDEFIYSYGVGDGGGGPTDLMVERAPYLQNLADVPRVTFGSVEGCLDHFRSRKDDLELWAGEIYFEGHRGTYTTQAAIKRDNRLLEIALRQLEFLYTSLPLSSYPKEAIDSIWKVLLLHQFHDILPGSSIHEVYEDSRKSFDIAFSDCEALMKAYAVNLPEAGDTLTIFNSSESISARPLRLPDSWRGSELTQSNGAPVLTQEEDGGTYILPELQPLGFTEFKRGRIRAEKAVCGVGLVLENEHVRYSFNRDASITSIVDKKTGYSYLAPQSLGNALSLYVDRPICWDAWDVDHLYQDELCAKPEALEEPERQSGTVRQTLKFRLKIGASVVTQTCVLAANSARVDFVTEVDWHERHRMLRVAFDTSISSTYARYEIQHGYIDRPTHHNTSWEAAKFEAPALRYINLNDGQRGVALLNDCKYGHKVLHSTMDLNLLRATTFPDYDADQGRHQFTYSILPYSGSFETSSILEEASALNNRPIIFENKSAALALPVGVVGKGVSVEAIKPAEDGNGLIVRFCESLGRSTTAKVTIKGRVVNAWETDLMEAPLGEKLSLEQGGVSLTLRPFELKTIRIALE